MREKKQVVFVRDDLIATAHTLDGLGTLTATRSGDQSEWSRQRNEALYRDRSAIELADAPTYGYGLLLDALEYRFSPNFRTAMFLRLARYIEDPDSSDDNWTELFCERFMTL